MNQTPDRLDHITEQWDSLLSRAPDPSLFDGLEREEAAQWFAYFYSLPRNGGKPQLRTHILALYDPFARRSLFPAGIRFSCNVYVGCGHHCAYCYTQTYPLHNKQAPRRKQTFRERFEKDLEELRDLELPPVPLHISNSTDPLQESLEESHRDTLFVLQRLAGGASDQFSRIRILSRNPAMLLDSEYLECIHSLRDKLTVQVSIPMVDEEVCRYYEPNVPAPRNRLEAIGRLCAAGVGGTMRIDPLFPRNPLPEKLIGGKKLADYEIHPAQTEQDLRLLVEFAAECGCKSLVYSALKIPRGRYVRYRQHLRPLEALYKDAAKQAPARFSGNYLRLPESYQKGELVRPIEQEAAHHNIPIEHCKHNLIRNR